ncbi:MAG: hypothetical protein WBN81_18275, partial [Gammaproteobacteria bacterium]
MRIATATGSFVKPPRPPARFYRSILSQMKTFRIPRSQLFTNFTVLKASSVKISLYEDKYFYQGGAVRIAVLEDDTDQV